MLVKLQILVEQYLAQLNIFFDIPNTRFVNNFFLFDWIEFIDISNERFFNNFFSVRIKIG